MAIARGEWTENNTTQTRLHAGEHLKTILITWSLIKRFHRIREHKNNTYEKMRSCLYWNRTNASRRLHTHWRMHLKQSANFQSSRINSNSSKSHLMNVNSSDYIFIAKDAAQKNSTGILRYLLHLARATWNSSDGNSICGKYFERLFLITSAFAMHCNRLMH